MLALTEPQTIIKKRVEVRKSCNASLIDYEHNSDRPKPIKERRHNNMAKANVGKT